jgi:hypothetical protein
MFLFSKTFRPALRLIHPPIQSIPGFFAGVQQLRRDTRISYSPPPIAKVKNEWSTHS